MESVSNDDDSSSTRNTTVTRTTTGIETSQENENPCHLDHNNDHCHLIHHHNIDEDDDGLNTGKVYDINEIDCSCPICLRAVTDVCCDSTGTSSSTTTSSSNNDLEFVYSSTCKHIYCFSCIQQILLYSSSSSSVQRTTNTRIIEIDSNNDSNNNNQIDPVITITQGVCPICRAELSYFDLKKIKIHIDENNNRKEEEEDKSTLQYKIIRSDELVVSKEDTTILPKELYGIKYQSSEDVSSHMMAIQFPNCFESDGTSIIGSDNIKLYDGVDDDDFYKKIQLCIVTKDDDNDGKEALHSYMTIKEYQYLSSTQTFKGSGMMYVESTDDDGNRNDYMMIQCMWMTFSENFQFVTHGVSRVAQRMVICTTCLACHPRIDSGTVCISAYGGDSRDQLIRIITNPSGNVTPPPPVPGKLIRYKNSTIWGNVYCQELSIGYASFHFIRSPKVGKKNRNDDNGMAFISYEHPKSANYLPLDNGRPLPSRVLFRNIICPNPHTFCGSICWEEDYGTTCLGSSRWDFIIKFDNKFMCIVSGTVHSVKTNRKKIEDSEQTPPVEEIPKLENTFGEDLAYVNAGLYDSFTEKIVSSYSDEFRWMTEAHDPKVLFLVMMDNSAQKITIVSDRLTAQGVPSFIVGMVTCILEAATLNSHYKLSLIIKDLPHSKAKDILKIIAQYDKNLLKNPIDLKYYYE